MAFYLNRDVYYKEFGVYPDPDVPIVQQKFIDLIKTYESIAFGFFFYE